VCLLQLLRANGLPNLSGVVRNNVKGKGAELGYILLCILFSMLWVCSLIYKKQEKGTPYTLLLYTDPFVGEPPPVNYREAGTLLSNRSSSIYVRDFIEQQPHKPEILDP
jgi:hypothetical protein